MYEYTHLVEQGRIETRLSGGCEKHEYFETHVFRFAHLHMVLQELNQDTHLLIQRHSQIPLRNLSTVYGVRSGQVRSSQNFKVSRS